MAILPNLTFRQACQKSNIGFGEFTEPDFVYSHSGNLAEKFLPAGGMGDWGEPQ